MFAFKAAVVVLVLFALAVLRDRRSFANAVLLGLTLALLALGTAEWLARAHDPAGRLVLLAVFLLVAAGPFIVAGYLVLNGVTMVGRRRPAADQPAAAAGRGRDPRRHRVRAGHAADRLGRTGPVGHDRHAAVRLRLVPVRVVRAVRVPLRPPARAPPRRLRRGARLRAAGWQPGPAAAGQPAEPGPRGLPGPGRGRPRSGADRLGREGQRRAGLRGRGDGRRPDRARLPGRPDPARGPVREHRGEPGLQQGDHGPAPPRGHAASS